MEEKFPSSDKLKILIAALERFQSSFNKSAYSTMGFWLLVLGWLLTSPEALKAIVGDQYLKYSALAFVWVGWLLYSYASYRVFKASEKIYSKLANWSYAEGAFEHAKMPLPTVVLYCIIMGVAVAFISVLIWNAQVA